MLAHAFFFCGLVRRQTNSVLHCFVVVGQPAKHAARQLLERTFLELLQFAVDRFGALFGVGVLVAVAGLSAFALEFLEQFRPIR